MSDIDTVLVHNRYIFLLLLILTFLTIIFWKVFRPKRWELPERYENVTFSSEDVQISRRRRIWTLAMGWASSQSSRWTMSLIGGVRL